MTRLLIRIITFNNCLAINKVLSRKTRQSIEMNRMRIPRQHRRYSLPAISHTLGVCRAVPEGSDTFQQALEELYTSEPDHAPIQNNTDLSLHGLTNIQEGDEEDDDGPIDEVRKLNRSHSSPSFFGKDTEIFGKSESKASDLKSGVGKSNSKKTLSSKDYFIRHGHWPEFKSKSINSAKKFSMVPTRTQTVAFGTSAK